MLTRTYFLDGFLFSVKKLIEINGYFAFDDKNY